MNKHAYLIIAHSNFYILEKLILLLDDSRNDIYVHIDLKTVDFDFDYFQNLPKKSKIIFIERSDVKWGTISQVQVELSLFKYSSKSYEYLYYHLISGVDLPLKSQNYIHDFFYKNKGYLFVGFLEGWNKDRVTRLQLFTNHLRSSSKIKFSFFRFLRLSFVFLQKIVQYKYRPEKIYKFKYGHNWVSVTNDFVIDLLHNEKMILDTYKHSNAPDEIYKQTFIYNSKYRNLIFNTSNDLDSCMRLIDWTRGSPYIYRVFDFQELVSSDKIFARKFDENIDKEIIDLIYCYLQNNKSFEINTYGYSN